MVNCFMFCQYSYLEPGATIKTHSLRRNELEDRAEMALGLKKSSTIIYLGLIRKQHRET